MGRTIRYEVGQVKEELRKLAEDPDNPREQEIKNAKMS